METVEKQPESAADVERRVVAQFLEQAIRAANNNACIVRYRVAKEW